MNSKKYGKKIMVFVILIVIILIGSGIGVVFAKANAAGETTTAPKPIGDVTPEYVRGLRVYPESAEIEYPIVYTEEEWQDRLSDMQYYVLREKGTERAFTGEQDGAYEPGMYYSAATGMPLFHSDAKYSSGTGWPSFFEPVDEDAVILLDDSSLFMSRIEVVDSSSGSHLGHLFFDGPEPTGFRYCLNSASLIFVPEGAELPRIVSEYQQRFGLKPKS